MLNLQKNKTLNNINLKENLIFLIGFFAIIFCIFQFVSFNLMFSKFDTQPYCFILFLCYLILIDKIYIPRFIIINFFVILLGLAISAYLTTNINFNNLFRLIFIISSFFVIFLGFLNFITKHGFPLKIFICCNFLLIFFGIIQIYNPEIINFFLEPRGVKEYGRGYTSLTKEPFLFSLSLIYIFMNILAYKKYKFDSSLIILFVINIFTIIFLSQSFYGLLLVFFLTFFYLPYLFIINKNFFLLSLLFLSFIFVIIIFIFAHEDILVLIKFHLPAGRIQELLMHITTFNYNLFLYDQSLSHRLLNSYKAFFGLYQNNFLPHGFDMVNDYVLILREKYSFFWSDGSARIWSYAGIYFFYFGFLGILFWIINILNIFKNRFIEGIVTMIVIFFNIPGGFGLIICYFAVCFQINNKKN